MPASALTAHLDELFYFHAMKILVCALVLIGSMSAGAQTVPLLSLDQLDKRLAAGGDTTYVINFWATWCTPCIMELPAFEKLNERAKDDKLKVLLVSVDFRSKLKSAVEPFVKRKKLQSEVVLLNEDDPNEYIDRVSKNWNGSIPATLFVRKGKRFFAEKTYGYKQLFKDYNKFKTS